MQYLRTPYRNENRSICMVFNLLCRNFEKKSFTLRSNSVFINTLDLSTTISNVKLFRNIASSFVIMFRRCESGHISVASLQTKCRVFVSSSTSQAQSDACPLVVQWRLEVIRLRRYQGLNNQEKRFRVIVSLRFLESEKYCDVKYRFREQTLWINLYNLHVESPRLKLRVLFVVLSIP